MSPEELALVERWDERDRRYGVGPKPPDWSDELVAGVRILRVGEALELSHAGHAVTLARTWTPPVRAWR